MRTSRQGFECLTRYTMTIVTVGTLFWLLLVFPSVRPQEQTEHRDFQYNSVVDPATGRYNFAYDTGNDNDIAHSMHMQYQDADGIVRGRYGYTDPNGKLRVVEYEAGPNGFIARGDVGPDGFPHDEAPAPSSAADTQPALASYNENSGNDFELDPAPVQMAGWDPEMNPMTQTQPGGVPASVGSAVETENSIGNEYSILDPSNQLMTVNDTRYNALELYGPELGFYTDRYPRVIYSLSEGSAGSESENLTNHGNETKMEPQIIQKDATVVTLDGNVHINLDPAAARSSRVPRSPLENGNETQTELSKTKDLEAQSTGQDVRVTSDSFQIHGDHRDIHDHHAEEVSKHTHDHNHESYYVPHQDHDHSGEQNSTTQTHDHDAEKYLLTHEKAVEDYKTHNHDPNTNRDHEHASEKYRNHNHAAEHAEHLRRRIYYYYPPRKMFYKNSHDVEPHEHYHNSASRYYRDHQHSQADLYRRYTNYIYPTNARLSDVRYIPSYRYHDRMYYWSHE